MFFSWIRNQVKAAVLGGVADAAAELGDVLDVAEASRQLQHRLESLPAPAAEPEAEGNGRRKASTSRKGE
jgi:hypothetical protein